MHSNERVHRIRERAYEIYCTRDPQDGSAEDDWWKAEREIERQEQLRATPRHNHPDHLRELVTPGGKDIENPT
ncbi:MAG: DUF2934 domain-containing protein [Candidatus Acidiferrum sp.]